MDQGKAYFLYYEEYLVFVILSNYIAVLYISVFLGSGVGKWGEPGKVLAPEGPPTDAVCPRTLS